VQDRNRIIVALDYADAEQAIDLLKKLTPENCRVKVGKELFTRFGPELIHRIHALGFQIFLDLKFHDIPNTVNKSVSAACDLGIWMLTLHAAGGKAMLDAAREAVKLKQSNLLLVAVTVLTSLSDEDLRAQGIQRSTLEQVQRMASLAQGCGMDGVVCSAAESSALRKLLSDDFLLVTPGIRPAGDPAQDQKRVVTPVDAINAGSSYLVIGRPITQAKHPADKLKQIIDEISGAI
jgi:orotidine-5'-phosphate decarboxylase